jgi:hypothetical protein
MAEDFAREEWGIDLTSLRTNHPKLPFMGDSGCVVPAHLRPLCTLHVCSINNIGIKATDMEWTNKYFELRDQINDLENIRSIQKESL